MRRIFAEAQQQGLPQPSLTEIATGVRMSIPLAQRHTVGAHAAEPEAEATTTPAVTPAVEVPPESRLESRLESKLAAKVVLQLQEQELGKAALSQGLGHRSVSGELHKQVSRLLERGLIAMTIPDKPQSRLQRYRLTPQGLALLTTLNTKENPSP